MKQLLMKTDAIQKIVTSQKRQAETMYRESRFCVHVPCEKGELLYNTLTGALVLLETGETEQQNMDRLIEERFWIPNDYDEQAYCDSLRKISRMLHPEKNKKHFTILTTTDCNARCYYCYEMGIRRFSMSEKTANDVVAYIARVSKGERVTLNWFGGEPLYNSNVIEIICNGLKKRGVSYQSTMISNGFFLDPDTANDAKKNWNMTNVQITLDGTEHVYNQTKAYTNCNENAFRRVLDNIEAAIALGINISIRLNMDSKNADDLFGLADELSSRFRGRKEIHTYVQLLQEVTGKIGAFSSEQLAAEKCIELTNKLVEQGLTVTPKLNRDLITNRCMADNDACEVIAPDGKICRCEHYKESEIVGSIYNDERNQDLVDTWKEYVTFPECKECVLYPRCFILKKCDWSAKGCPESIRTFKTERMKRQILVTFRESAQRLIEEK